MPPLTGQPPILLPAFRLVGIVVGVRGLNGRVGSARLRLYADKASSYGGSIYLVSDNTWTEGDLTWNCARGLEGMPLTIVEAVAAGSCAEFDVTAAIQGDGVYSFSLSSTSSNRVTYNSKEAASNWRPVLLIELQNVP